MINESITFDKLPQAVSYLTEQVIELKPRIQQASAKLRNVFVKALLGGVI